MNNKLNISAVQSMYSKNVNKNLNTAIRYMNECSENTDLIVFPELFSTGYFMDEGYIQRNAEPVDGKFVDSIQKQAVKNNIYVVLPFLEKYENSIYNSVAVIDREGNIKGIKRKSINWKAELGFISESDITKNLEMYDIEGFRIGILICYEASFPETARAMANKGCDAIIVPAFWNKNALHHWDIQLRARALDNNVYVIGVNGLIHDRSCGHTMIVSPNGEIMKSLGEEEGVVSAYLDKSHIDKVRKDIPYFTDYLYYLNNKTF